MASKRVENIVKRLFDLVVASISLLVFSPWMALIATGIRISSGSPILFRWEVVGQDGQPFTSWKFRTMVAHASQLKQDLNHHNEMSGPVFKMKEDPRITPIGGVLRKFSLDELPQLWSVLQGDMSMVGPRPPLLSEFERFSDWHKKKLAMKPGMTSLWHVRGKPRDFDEWVKLDLEYIEHWSLWLDVKILAQTAMVVLTGKNY